jgi:hypothetical protein
MNTNASVNDLDPALRKRALDVADEGIIIADVRQPMAQSSSPTRGSCGLRAIRQARCSGGTAGSSRSRVGFRELGPD